MSESAPQHKMTPEEEDWVDPKLEAHIVAARARRDAARAYKQREVIDMTLADLNKEKARINAMQTEDNQKESQMKQDIEATVQAMDALAKTVAPLRSASNRLRNRRAMSFAQTQEFEQKLIDTCAARIRMTNELQARVAQLEEALREQSELSDEYLALLNANGITF